MHRLKRYNMCNIHTLQAADFLSVLICMHICASTWTSLLGLKVEQYNAVSVDYAS